ncbi:MAG TPA: YicC family protein [Geobacteraceae bacterium]|nr:YicC family protein [Geobacteraceae bacterium]
MIKSMTGYGKAEAVLEQGKITIEMRSVNHRYGEISVKLPRSLICFENEVRKTVSSRLKRGKIDVFIQLDTVADSRPPVVNVALARAYHAAFLTLSEDLGLREPISLSLLVSQKDVLSVGESDIEADSMREDLLSAVESAVSAMETMRLREGRELVEDLRGRRRNLSLLIDAVSRRSSLVPAEYAEKLSLRLAQFGAKNLPDEARLAQEVVLMADRCDITEELVRFGSHLVQFDAALESSEPVGRKLDFLLQEMGREVNTIGSKANDGEIAGCVVELKAELEKIREQVQNIE